MKLREVHVDRYGPLRETLQFGDAHVVYGPNESGKTLLVESLLRSLTGDRRVAQPRIDESPEGYVALDGEGDRFELANGETLLDRYAERYNFELTPAEFRNVFVVRDGDLRVLDEQAFYRRVTDRVVGIWTGDIETVRDRVVERGRLTPEGWELSTQHDDAAEQHDLATDLLADVEAYLDRADAEDLDAAERACYEAARERREAEAEVEALEAAKAREDYEQLVKTKGSLERSLDERAELPDEGDLDELSERLDDLATGSEDELQRRKTWYGRATLAALAAGVVAGAVPLGLGIREPQLVAAGPAAFGVVALVALAAYRSASNAVVRLGRDREAVVERASEVGIDAYDPPAVRGAIADYREEHDNHAEVIQGNTEVLRQWLDIDAEAPRDVVAEAEDALEARRAEIDFDADREFTEEKLEDARERAEAAAEREGERRETLRDHRRQLERFAERAGGVRFEAFTGEPLDLTVANLGALADLADRLREVVDAIETDADVSRAAATVLDRMAASETEKMTTLFADGEAADVFRRVTDDRYVDVGLTDDSRLTVELASGERLGPAELSRGTRDQLYLAVRVALGRRLMEGRDGFFLMDDAFLSADPQRLERQAEVLGELVDSGWQVVYLTCKPDARDALAETAGADVTELSPL
ncbi:ATP-binding protein [Halosimplex pelagicum]|uniref:AAA family ATPase n=1 Tax=Halosimplex pelagicum TaxID=869886 RepID=A0A7D5STQ4_9EURY|nr:AAA family ATPase [Halosimplex pelagicum]QLH80647.1 AAA family ATPase [Halosimplex pelagicum]